ncbi:MAG TPA: LacI family DNA-binding transcriptional regulator [Candidatus Udaeobacter sp.]|nr:LacI family DNA-binding transcriptional regulator [Candidatus Udaeobacter sp.]
MKITINDIAKMAGVSISTVSRVLNNSKPVKEEARKRVMEAIKQTDYRHSALAGGVKKSESCLIGVIIPLYIHTVLDEFIIGIKNVANLYGYDVLITQTDGTIESELHHLKLFRKLQTHGIIFAGTPIHKKHADFIESTPCIAIGQISSIPSIPSVHVDNITAAYEAVTSLIHKGHRNIAIIRGTGISAVGGERFIGYRQALTEAGISIRKDWVVDSEFSVEEGMRAMGRIAASGLLPTAVFCSTDLMALGAMNYLLDNGLRIPEDISVFGFDGTYMSTIVRPRLSTVEYSATEIGMTAARNLFKMIKGATDIPQHTNVTHYLAIRDSTH